MSSFERDFVAWLEGKTGREELEARHGAEALQVMALHAQLSNAPIPALPDFATIAASLEPRPLGVADRIRARFQRPLAAAVGTILMTGGTAYATVQPVRDAVDSTVQQIGQVLGLVEDESSTDNGGTPESDGDKLLDDPVRRDDEPADESDDGDEDGNGRGDNGDRERDREDDGPADDDQDHSEDRPGDAEDDDDQTSDGNDDDEETGDDDTGDDDTGDEAESGGSKDDPSGSGGSQGRDDNENEEADEPDDSDDSEAGDDHEEVEDDQSQADAPEDDEGQGKPDDITLPGQKRSAN